MRRIFILLLAVLLPLQFTWAAAAVYCGHEGSVAGTGMEMGATAMATEMSVSLSNASTHHFGHHEHVHHVEPKKDAQKPLSLDLDCGVCHAGATPVIGAGLQLQAPADPALILAAPAAATLASAFSRAPDRPQWPVLA